MNAKSYRDYNDCGDQFKTTVTTGKNIYILQ